MQLLPLNNGPVEKSSFHGCYRLLGPQEVELEHSNQLIKDHPHPQVRMPYKSVRAPHSL